MKPLSHSTTILPLTSPQKTGHETSESVWLSYGQRVKDQLIITPQQCAGGKCSLSDIKLSPKLKAKSDYQLEDVKQNPLNKLGRFLIRYGYQWPTRRLPLISQGAQKTASRCGCRLCGPTELSCSEYAYRAFEVCSAPWALAQMALRLVSCMPYGYEGGLADLVANPMPFKNFVAQAKETLSTRPLIEGSDLADLSYAAKQLTTEVLMMPVTLAKKLVSKEKLNVEKKSDSYFESKGDPGPCKAFLNFNIRRWYFLGQASRKINAKNFENKRLNAWKIEPD